MTDQQINAAIGAACGWPILDNPPKGFYPDYCNDLNAMHEAEKTLNNGQIEIYCGFLHKKNHGVWWGTHATARERAEAFLRTLGKWEVGAE